MFFERYYPRLTALAVALLLWLADFFFGWNVGFPGEDTKFLLTASVSSSAIFTAFLTTTLSFLMGLDTPAARRVSETKYHGLFLSYFKEGIISSLIFCGVSMLGYYWQDYIWYFYAWVFCGVLAVFAFWRCASLLFSMLRKNKTKY